MIKKLIFNDEYSDIQYAVAYFSCIFKRFSIKKYKKKQKKFETFQTISASEGLKFEKLRILKIKEKRKIT